MFWFYLVRFFSVNRKISYQLYCFNQKAKIDRFCCILNLVRTSKMSLFYFPVVSWIFRINRKKTVTLPQNRLSVVFNFYLFIRNSVKTNRRELKFLLILPISLPLRFLFDFFFMYKLLKVRFWRYFGYFVFYYRITKMLS